MSDSKTPAQQQALEKAWDLLCEHFERVLLVVDFEIEHNGKLADQHSGFWHGGALAAIGAAEYAKQRILESNEKNNEPE